MLTVELYKEGRMVSGSSDDDDLGLVLDYLPKIERRSVPAGSGTWTIDSLSDLTNEARIEWGHHYKTDQLVFVILHDMDEDTNAFETLWCQKRVVDFLDRLVPSTQDDNFIIASQGPKE